MPTMRALECFVAVVESGSLRAAAERLHTSQPAVSHQVAALENEIGVPLFERLPRGVSPTAAGRAIFLDALAAITAAGRVRETGRAVAAGKTGTLRIGCAASMIISVLPPTLRRWRSLRPEVTLTVFEADSADVLARKMRDNEIDVALSPRPTEPGHDVTVVGTEDVLLALANDHPLATVPGPVPVVLLDGLDSVLYSALHGLGEWIESRLAAQGVTTRPVLRTRQTYGAARLAEAGLGVALVPAAAVPDGFRGALRRLDPPLSRDVVAFHRGGADPFVQEFVDDVQKRGIVVSAAGVEALEKEPRK